MSVDKGSGRIDSLQLCPGHRKPMVQVPSARAVQNSGLADDRHSVADSSRQILLVEKEVLDDLGLYPGQVKENITISGIGLMVLPNGRRLVIGEEVILELTKACSPCSRMEEIRPGLLGAIAGRRGMLACVVRGGNISVGDAVRVIGD